VEEAINMLDRRRRAYDPSNLRALCHDCHVKTHTELGRCGKEATKRRNEKQVAQVLEKFFGD
jgi:5-methylcytosine-specific restriction protein A